MRESQTKTGTSATRALDGGGCASVSSGLLEGARTKEIGWPSRRDTLINGDNRRHAAGFQPEHPERFDVKSDWAKTSTRP